MSFTCTARSAFTKHHGVFVNRVCVWLTSHCEMLLATGPVLASMDNCLFVRLAFACDV